MIAVQLRDLAQRSLRGTLKHNIYFISGKVNIETFILLDKPGQGGETSKGFIDLGFLKTSLSSFATIFGCLARRESVLRNWKAFLYLYLFYSNRDPRPKNKQIRDAETLRRLHSSESSKIPNGKK